MDFETSDWLGFKICSAWLGQSELLQSIGDALDSVRSVLRERADTPRPALGAAPLI